MTFFSKGDVYRQRAGYFWYSEFQEEAIAKSLNDLQPSAVAIAQIEIVLLYASNFCQDTRAEKKQALDRSKKLLLAVDDLKAYVFEKDHMWALDGSETLPFSLNLIAANLQAEIDGFEVQIRSSSPTRQPNQILQAVVDGAFNAWQLAGGHVKKANGKFNRAKKFRAFFDAATKPPLEFHRLRGSDVAWTSNLFNNSFTPYITRNE